MKKLFYLCCIVAACVLQSCLNDDEFDPNGFLIVDPMDITVEFQENGEPMLRGFTEFTDAEHEATAASVLFGSGWWHVETHEILENGTVDPKDYWKDLYGGGPHDWYFETHTQFTKYFYFDAKPALAFSKEKVSVDLRSGKVTTDDSPLKLMQLVALYQASDSWRLITIEPGGIRTGRQIFHLHEYRTMTAEELKKIQTEYTYDWKNEKQ